MYPWFKVVTSIFFVIKQLAGSPTQQLVENLFSRFGNLVEVNTSRGVYLKDFFWEGEGRKLFLKIGQQMKNWI